MAVISSTNNQPPHFEVTIKPIPGWGKVRYLVKIGKVTKSVQEPLAYNSYLIRYKRKYEVRIEKRCYTLWGAIRFARRIIRRAQKLDRKLEACLAAIKEVTHAFVEEENLKEAEGED